MLHNKESAARKNDDETNAGTSLVRLDGFKPSLPFTAFHNTINCQEWKEQHKVCVLEGGHLR